MHLTGLLYSLLALTLFIAVILSFISLTKKLDIRFNFLDSDLMNFTSSLVMATIYLALCGIILSCLPNALKKIIGAFFIFLPILLGLLQLIREGCLNKASLNSRGITYIAATYIFSVLLLILANTIISLGDTPDGAYVNKENINSVRIQRLAGNLPADNVLPFIAQEYLAKSLSFTENSPILPGQPVTNRPFLVSLIALPFRLVLLPIENEITVLPKFSYVGQDWPDYRILARNQLGYATFMGIGVFLNASLLLAAGLFSLKLWREKKFDVLLILLFVSSPFYIFQTIFLWPKSLAAFYILFGAYIYLKSRLAFLSGLLIGLAYLSHPYAVGYFIVGLLFILGMNFRDKLKGLRNAGQFSISFLITILPWIVWKDYIVNIPSNMVSQNLFVEGMAWQEFIWVRVVSMMRELLPVHFLANGFNYVNFYIESSLNLVGAVGTLFFIGILLMPFSDYSNFFSKVKSSGDLWPINLKGVFLYSLISNVLLACTFSFIGVPLVHGGQILPVIFMMLGIHWLVASGRIPFIFAWIQVALNFILFSIYLVKLL
jgi:hypothetical protein